MIDFSELDLITLSSRATVLAKRWPQIREITLYQHCIEEDQDDPQRSFVMVIQHDGSLQGVREGKFLEHVCGLLAKKSIGGLQDYDCLIWPTGPDEPLPEEAVDDVSKTLYKKEGTTQDEESSEETPEEKQRKKLEEQLSFDKEPAMSG